MLRLCRAPPDPSGRSVGLPLPPPLGYGKSAMPHRVLERGGTDGALGKTQPYVCPDGPPSGQSGPTGAAVLPAGQDFDAGTGAGVAAGASLYGDFGGGTKVDRTPSLPFVLTSQPSMSHALRRRPSRSWNWPWTGKKKGPLQKRSSATDPNGRKEKG